MVNPLLQTKRTMYQQNKQRIIECLFAYWSQHNASPDLRTLSMMSGITEEMILETMEYS
ncbi:hypothetical protein CAY60_007985 [Shouchella clausii]|jgi:hypothetical protein|uniref:Uncharacterized protein n=1 Tax=Shouchella rhizosphaerae TaxID=866786 RepID=A0ABZ2CSX6_9BACI|nr:MULTISPECIES: hypothetical protein [Shouchella]MCM3312525.1 hypothetical protein [Psychrobacillus sp. MER TA 17]ALA51074.1 hypothetical protein DB29_00246 [Shouchella clausii]MBU3231870.1 hypothetical protein [Shouchella clausii]MBU3264846.1 hypothetical protein [Shouchella clausii]MBU3507691.1 hypothetical protein [Shouchella clausii]